MNPNFRIRFLLTVILIGLAGGCLTSPRSAELKTTLPPPIAPPSTALVISDIKSVSTINSATITWRTNLEADSLVRYGTATGKYSHSEGSRTYLKNHTIGLSGLRPNTAYYFRVGSVTPDGIASQTKEYNITTLFLPPPVISNISVKSGYDNATVTWRTEPETTGELFYGTSRENLDELLYVERAYYHNKTLNNLFPGTTYYLKIKVTDENDLSTESEIVGFTTRTMGEGESLEIGNLTLKIGYIDDHYFEDHFLSTIPLEIINNGRVLTSLSNLGAAALGSDKRQYNSVNGPGEFTQISILPGATISKKLYFERLPEGFGTIYFNLEDSANRRINLKVEVNVPEQNETTTNGVYVSEEVKQETKKSLEINIDKVLSSYEELSKSRSRLYVKIDITFKNIGDSPVSIKLTPKPGIVDDKGVQHIYVKNTFPDTPLFPGGSISGSIYFSPELTTITNEFTLFLYINSVKNKYILKVF